MNRYQSTIPMARFYRCLLALLLAGLCQVAAMATPPLKKLPGTWSVEKGRLVPKAQRVQAGMAAQAENGISGVLLCSQMEADHYTNYQGINLSDYYSWYWMVPSSVACEETQTVLSYESGTCFYFTRGEGADNIEAIKLFLDKNRTNDASIICAVLELDGSLSETGTEVTYDYENGVIYWKPDAAYEYDNIVFYISEGQLHMAGFEIYSQGNTPADFFSGGSTTDPGTVGSPVFVPASATFYSPMAVEIKAAEGLTIYYRTDGEDPVVDEQYKYNGPVVISSTTTFKAIAVDSEGNQSPVATATYTCTYHGIGEGYNPTSPGNPGSTTGEEEATYRLTVVANPTGAGSVYSNSSSLKAGAQTRVYCYNSTGFVFKNWTIEGTEVSATSSFNYVMPDHDVTIVANYEYNPTSPGNPSPLEQTVKHPVVVRAIPSVAASLSPSGTFSMEENTSRQVYAYPNTGWRLTGWTINGEQQEQTTSPLSITMGEKALDIAAYFSYEPTPPGNPGANYYNPTTGQAIVDDFTPGDLYSALSNLVGYSNFSNVSSLIVKGQITSNDLGNLDYFSNAGTIDLSRTGGVSALPGYTFQNMGAASIVLPSTITSLGNRVFSGCANLASLTLYAQEPPACTSTTFTNFTNSTNCTVYVPASAIELYTNADYWKDFTILPITTDAHVLQVNLPADAADGRYKHNAIEIVNINSGVRQRYVVSDRLLYTFNNLQKDEQYNVYMLSQAGLEIGRIENVTIPDQDIEVTFDALKPLHTVSAQVLTPGGEDVTDGTTVEWLKPQADGTTVYLRKAVSLGEVPEGQQLLCRVTLNERLGTAYAAPADTTFTVAEGQETCALTLTPLRAVTLTGIVTDGDGAALAGAAVSASQTLNGKYTKTYTAKTDREGRWTLAVLDAPETRLVYAATECVNVTDTLGAFAAGISTLDLGSTALRSIVGARITYGFTYHAAGADEVETYYSDYENVALGVFNVTQNRAHGDLSLQYPTLAVLDEHINPGDELRLTATSKTGAFNPVEQTVTVDDRQRAEVTFDIVGKGGIAASFEMTDNPAVAAMLYSAKGELMQKVTYSEAQATFTELEDGNYTLVTMGQSDLMNAILRLTQFAEIGLTEGKDYVKNEVTVESGKLTEVRNAEIPAFDESLFYYTNSSTSFTSNKSSLTTGNYLTLRSAVDFKSVYKTDITNVALVVDLPEACDFVEQSVIQGSNLLPYTLDNGRLTVQLGNSYTSQVRFCVVPTTGGNFNATASVVFDYQGRTLTQPIGAAASEIKDIEIVVPSVVTQPQFTVKGIAQSKSEIRVYDRANLIGTAISNSNGTWTASCLLDNPYNLSTHDISARITTPQSTELVTESKEVYYNTEGIQASEVVMTFYDASPLNKIIKWDLLDGTCDRTSYSFSSTSYTFLVKFTENDPERIRNVVLNVFPTNSSRVIKLVPTYDAEKQYWIASSNFSSSTAPSNVSVDYEVLENPLIDSDFVHSNLFKIEEDKKDIDFEMADFNGIHSQLDTELSKTDADEDEIERLLSLLHKEVGYESTDNSKEFSMEQIETHLAQMKEKENANAEILQNLCNASIYDESLSEYMQDATITTCESLSPETLLADGFEEVENTKSQKIYFYSDETIWRYVDFSENVSITIDLTGQSELARLMKAPANSSDPNEWIEKLNTASRKIYDLVTSIDGFLSECTSRLYDMIKEEAEDYTLMQEELDYLKKKGTADKSYIRQLERQIANSAKRIKELDGVAAWVEKTFKQFMTGGGKIMGKAFSFSALLIDGADAVNTVREMWQFRDSIKPPCEEVRQQANKLWTDADGWIVKAGTYYVAKLAADICELAGVTAGIAALIPSGGTSSTAILASIGVMAVNLAADMVFEKNKEKFKARTTDKLHELAKYCQNPDPNNPPELDKPSPNNNGNTDPNHYPNPRNPHTNPTTPIIDPSGFVYEAVPSNRVEGVQATIYYKETKEDMYGDPYEEVVLWNAEEYAQQNPLFTDENGMYQWDVPQGLWQVKFEKDGYQTAYSEWLPVPPPQLEVNIALTQNKQPEVTEARAYEEGVEVQFDKFMDIATLNPSNIYVTAGGEKLDGEIRLIDSSLADEYASEDDAEATRYASRIRFVPAEPLSATAGEVRLTVSRNVLSYAGIPMTETFSQALDIEKEVQSIYADPVKVLYGGEKQLTVYALPFDAAVGRTLRIVNSSELITSVDKQEVTLDEEGKAVITVKGSLPGRAQLTFTIDDVTATGECAVDVVTELITAEAPKASRASGTAVYRGTKVALTTESKDAVIYFTTDGTCPCDDNGTRRKYTVPIIINGDTQILAMTSVGDGDEDVSETVEFNYTLKRADVDFKMDEGWTWISHNLENAVAPSALAADEGVARILSQTQEVIRDPQLGMVGTLTELSPTESYKVLTTSATARQRLSDVAWNPATPIALKAGWNWLGYPVDQTMTVNEALAPTAAEELDVIVGQNGFAQFDGEQWVGTLETLSPGMGYMFQSQSAKNAVYNTSIVSTASAQHAPGIADNLPFALDVHKYPSVMPVFASLSNADGFALDNEQYQVAAFCGTECRGIGHVVNGLVLISVYGSPDDRITFQVTDADGETAFGTRASLDFGENVVGSLFHPYVLTLDGTTGIANAEYAGGVRVTAEDESLRISGIAADDIESVEIYDAEGHKLVHETHVPQSGLCLATLKSGVYVVVVKGNGKYTYHKIAFAKK